MVVEVGPEIEQLVFEICRRPERQVIRFHPIPYRPLSFPWPCRDSAGVFEFLLVYGGLTWTLVDDCVQSAKDLRNKFFVCGVFRWSDRAAF